jgi:hypothetical protein
MPEIAGIQRVVPNPDPPADLQLNQAAPMLSPLSKSLAVVFFLLLVTPAQATIISLYNGAGLPADQLWLTYADNSALSGGVASQSPVTGGVRLLTDATVKAGYSNYTPFQSLKNSAFPVLNRHHGFELNFQAALTAENHSGNDRAGFSVTLLSDDLYGIELGFWSSRIWAQSDSPLFQQAEATNVSTAAPHNYRLQVLNNSYTLFQSETAVLAGQLRNYSAFPGPVNPYSLSNFLFLGDNTSSASADLQLGPVSLKPSLLSVPEPTPPFLLLISVAAAAVCARSRRKLPRPSPTTDNPATPGPITAPQY